MSLEVLVLSGTRVSVSVFFVSLSVWPIDRVVSGWWVPVHGATTMNLYCGITDPARSLTTGNELLRPSVGPFRFERGLRPTTASYNS